VFLALAAKYESLKLPLAVVLVVPMWLVAPVPGLLIRGMPIDILAQIGFMVLIGLAAKNAILIVEFAHQREQAGESVEQAAVSGARVRLRPILMTSFAFILNPGCRAVGVPTGAGVEMRPSLRTAVFNRMIGVTGFGLIFAPSFYTIVRGRVRETQRQQATVATHSA
jgi:HAE1 family hydrophobic/amphiphilic exporter-1